MGIIEAMVLMGLTVWVAALLPGSTGRSVRSHLTRLAPTGEPNP